MTRPVLTSYEIPMFADVSLLGHVQHECAIIMPSRIARMDLLAVTFWRAEMWENSPTLRVTNYYGPSAVYMIKPRTIEEARRELGAFAFNSALDMMQHSLLHDGWEVKKASKIERAPMLCDQPPPPKDSGLCVCGHTRGYHPGDDDDTTADKPCAWLGCSCGNYVAAPLARGGHLKPGVYLIGEKHRICACGHVIDTHRGGRDSMACHVDDCECRDFIDTTDIPF